MRSCLYGRNLVSRLTRRHAIHSLRRHRHRSRRQYCEFGSTAMSEMNAPILYERAQSTLRYSFELRLRCSICIGTLGMWTKMRRMCEAYGCGARRDVVRTVASVLEIHLVCNVCTFHTCVNRKIYFRKVNSCMDLVYYHAHKHIHGMAAYALLLASGKREEKNFFLSMARKAHHRPNIIRCNLYIPPTSIEIVKSIIIFIFFARCSLLLFAARSCCVGSPILLLIRNYSQKADIAQSYSEECGTFPMVAPTNLFKIPTIFGALNQRN